MCLFDDEIVRVCRSLVLFVIVLIDFDWFKCINDDYGYFVGDEVFCVFVIIIFVNICFVDCFGCYGGEEFLLLFLEMLGDVVLCSFDCLCIIVVDFDWSVFLLGMCVIFFVGVVMLCDFDIVDIFFVCVDCVFYFVKV